MLTIRQKRILNELLKRKDTYLKSSELADFAKVSTKTIHAEMKVISGCLLDSSTRIHAQSGKGYMLETTDEHELRLRIDISDSLYSTSDIDFSDQSTRVKYIMQQLLNKDMYIQSEELADTMYLSRSRMSADLQIVRKIFSVYHLDILSKPGYGICAKGSEQDKRMCIVKEHIPIFEHDHEAFEDENILLHQIGDTVMEILIDHHYKVSDLIFQNIVAHIAVALKRIYDHHKIENTMDEARQKEYPKSHEYHIASAIMQALENVYKITIDEEEKVFLAISLQGKRNYDNDIIISAEIDTFIIRMLEKIHQSTGIDMGSDTDLRLALSLHVMPLLTRATYHMMLKNSMKNEIKKSFPLAYEMAIVGASYLGEVYHFELSEDEIAYLAVHFSIGLEKYSEKRNPRKVLIISSSRQGETLLLQRQFLKWFANMIDELKIVNYVDLKDVDISSYEAIFTTSMVFDAIPANAVKINYFMNKSDYDRIYKILTNESNMEQLLDYFHQDLMLVVKQADSKERILEELCQLASKKYDLGDALFDAVLRREQLGFTSFGNYIAVPHPDHLFTKQTFVVVALLKQPILWGEEQVRIVLLVNVAKNQEHKLRVIFQAISKLMSNRDSVQEILKEDSFASFMEVLNKVVEEI